MPRLTAEVLARAASFIVEAVSTGNTLAAFPPEMAPSTSAQARRVAGLVGAGLGLPVVGVRLTPPPPGVAGPPVAGPVFAPRLLHGPIVPPPLHRPVVTAALVAQLAQTLPVRDRAWTLRALLPRLGSLHVALDMAASRYTAGPANHAAFMADLAGLGAIVIGPPARAGWQERVTAAQQARATDGEGAIAWRGMIDPGAALSEAADSAGGIGALPAGAVLVAAGLSPPLPSGVRTLSVTGLGKVALLAADA